MPEVVIWDCDGLPSPSKGRALLWRSQEEPSRPECSSISRLVEEDSDEVKAKFLAWVYQLGEIKIDNLRIVDHLQLRSGLSFWWMTLFVEKCNYAASPWINDAVKLLAFGNWAKNQGFDRVTLESRNECLAESLRLWCKKSGVKFRWQRDFPQQSKNFRSRLRLCYDNLPAVFRAGIWFVRHIFDRWPLRGCGVEQWKLSNANICFVSYLFNLDSIALTKGRFESRYWTRLPALLGTDGCRTNWLHIFIKNPIIPDAKKASSVLKSFNHIAQAGQVHVALESFLSIRTILATLRDWFRISIVSARLQRRFVQTVTDHPELLPFVFKEWRNSMQGPTALSGLLSWNLFDAAMAALPRQRMGVYLQENQGWEFGFLHAWKSNGHAQIVGFPHSTVRYWDLRYFFDPRCYVRGTENPMPMPDRVAINGPAAMQAYKGGVYPSQELIEVEALRYLYLATPVERTGAGKRPDKWHGIRLLVLGDYTARNTEMQMRLLEEAAQNFPRDTVVIVKPHPACPIDPRGYPKLSASVTFEPIGNLLQHCDIAYASAATSAAVDAYCAGVPVIVVHDLETLNLSPLRGLGEIQFVATSKELVEAVERAAAKGLCKANQHDLFCVDGNLPRWKTMLLSNEPKN